MKSFILVVLFYTVCVSSLNDTNEANETETDIDGRKRYGLGFHGPCVEFVKVFKCMADCKSLGYRVYRLDRKCKCMCLDMQTTDVLPYFKWKTTGTPEKVPTTRSARVYDVVGTLSPFPTWYPTEKSAGSTTCQNFDDFLKTLSPATGAGHGVNGTETVLTTISGRSAEESDATGVDTAANETESAVAEGATTGDATNNDVTSEEPIVTPAAEA